MKTQAYDIAFETGLESEYRFGMDLKKVVAALHETIDEIESGKLLMQRASFETKTSSEEYTTTVVNLEFVDRQQ